MPAQVGSHGNEQRTRCREDASLWQRPIFFINISLLKLVVDGRPRGQDDKG